jgi:hypothetical protein
MAHLVVAALTLAASVAAWAGLAWLVLNVPPSRQLAVLAAYVFAFGAITGTAAVVAWLALGRGRRSPASYLAHTMLFALIVLFAVWLQTLRTLTPVVAVLLIGLYVLLELAVLFGTRGSVELPVRRSS